MQQSRELAYVTRQRLQHDSAIVLDDEIESRAGLELQVLADPLRDGHLAFGRQRRFGHGIPPYNYYYTLLIGKEISNHNSAENVLFPLCRL